MKAKTKRHIAEQLPLLPFRPLKLALSITLRDPKDVELWEAFGNKTAPLSTSNAQRAELIIHHGLLSMQQQKMI